MGAFVRASRVEAAPVEWVIEGLIPRARLTLIAGRPGEGKSLFEVWAAAEVTNRGEAVLISNVEDTVEDQRARLDAAGAVTRRVHFSDPNEQLLIPRDLERLERKVKQTRAALVVLDTAARHITTSIFDPQACQRALGPLAAMARRCNCGVILIHHLKGQTSKGVHPLEAIGGARGGLVGTCRFVYVFGRHDGDPDERVLAPVKVNNAPDNRSVVFEIAVQTLPGKGGEPIEAPYLLITSGAARVNAKAVVTCSGGDSSAAPNQGKLVIAKDWLISTLIQPVLNGDQDAVVKTTDLQLEAQVCGISWGTLRRALADDAVGAVKVRRGYGKTGYWAWRLPDEHPAVKLAQNSRPLIGA